MTADPENPITPPYGGNVGQPPWAAIGMSRSNWYRLGKPTEKPYRTTQLQRAKMYQISLRGTQRAARVLREAPYLRQFIWDGLISFSAAEKYLGNMDRMAMLVVDLQERSEAKAVASADNQSSELEPGKKPGKMSR